jgi:hypothetical protein
MLDYDYDLSTTRRVRRMLWLIPCLRNMRRIQGGMVYIALSLPMLDWIIEVH